MNKVNIWNIYSKIRILHSSNFSKTYQAKNIKTQNFVAIKEINKLKLVKPLETLLEDIEKILKIKENINILTIKEIIDSGDYLYLIMDLCLINLEEYLNIRDKSFSINEMKTILFQINKCLKMLRDNNIKIENIKLSHILMSLDEIDKVSIKLSNFNLNQYMNDENTLNFGIKKQYFTTAPEILKEDLFNDKNNIWSLGIIIYYLINKKYPYEGDSEIQLYNNIILINGKIKLSEDKLLNDLLEKMLKIDINERINWDDYFNHSFFEANKFPKFNIICKIHLKQFNFYCIDCQKNICELCINEHPFQSHKVISFSLIGLNDDELIEFENLFQSITNNIKKLNQIKENISLLINKRKLCKENIFIYENDMKNNFIKYYIDCLNIINQQLNFEEKIDIINIKENYIKCNYNIKESQLDEPIQIINYLDKYKMNELKENISKINNFTLEINKKEMKKCCELYLDEKKIQFSTKYEFITKGEYIIKIINKRLLTNSSFMFSSCSSLLSIDFSNFNTSNINNMYSMFSKCSSLTTLNLSNFNTSKVTNMMGMFYNCISLTTLDLTNFNTSNVTNMMGMFYGCYSLISLNLCSFNTIKVTNMFNMFSNCSSLTSLDLSNFNINNVTDMNFMFFGCSSLTILNLSNFNTNDKKININNIFDKVNKYCKIICNDEKIKQIQLKEFE